MLDLDPARATATPRDAATIVIARDAAHGIEVLCVERHRASGFLGGAVVFPGGKVDEDDSAETWRDLTTPLLREDDAENAWRTLAIAACREAFEEAAILFLAHTDTTDAALLDLRARIVKGETTLADFLRSRVAKLNTAALVPFARWITPTAEKRRFDARFFLARAPSHQEGAHDAVETTRSFWETPRDILARFDREEVQLSPPTHRTLEDLIAFANVDAAIAWAKTQALAPICPLLVPHRDAKGETIALALPGDPAHEIGEARTRGRSRFVLRGERWLPEDAPR